MKIDPFGGLPRINTEQRIYEFGSMSFRSGRNCRYFFASALKCKEFVAPFTSNTAPEISEKALDSQNADFYFARALKVKPV